MTPNLAGFPAIDGELLVDVASRVAAAEDFGRIVRRAPCAVVRPKSRSDVAAVLRFAGKRGIAVAARGEGHSTYGQALADDGIVLAMSGLNRIHEVRADRVTADAGARWNEVLAATLPRGLTPPALPDFLGLSVGGTLSAGGIGGSAHRYGAVVDNVLELDVVTGTGEMLTCSPVRHRDLFEAVLAGLGQCAVITRATLRLIAAPAGPYRVHRFHYRDLAAFLADQATLMQDERFDHVGGQVKFDEDGGRDFVLEAAGCPAPPAGLRFGGAEAEDLDYPDFVHRMDEGVDRLLASREWFDPHPWFNVILPASTVSGYVTEVLADLTVAGIGPGPILLYPMRREVLGTPLLRFPCEPVGYVFALLRTVPHGAGGVAAIVAENRRLFEAAAAVGGVRYPVDSVPFSAADWREHFGVVWDAYAAAKRVYDPNRILTPSQGVRSNVV